MIVLKLKKSGSRVKQEAQDSAVPRYNTTMPKGEVEDEYSAAWTALFGKSKSNRDQQADTVRSILKDMKQRGLRPFNAENYAEYQKQVADELAADDSEDVEYSVFRGVPESAPRRGKWKAVKESATPQWGIYQADEYEVYAVTHDGEIYRASVEDGASGEWEPVSQLPPNAERAEIRTNQDWYKELQGLETSYYLAADEVNGVYEITKDQVEGQLLTGLDFYDALAGTVTGTIYGQVSKGVYDRIDTEYGVHEQNRDFPESARRRKKSVKEAQVLGTKYHVTIEAEDELSGPYEVFSGTADLKSIIKMCKEHGTDCVLGDAAGFTKGWVHADGSYTLN